MGFPKTCTIAHFSQNSMSQERMVITKIDPLGGTILGKLRSV
jgi:hypothetical protein